MQADFLVGLSADFLDEQRRPVFPDIGLGLLEQGGVAYRFLEDYCPEYAPGQLDGLDVMISLKPRVTRASLEGITRLAAIGRCGVGYDNVDLAACTERDIAVYITPQGVVRPMAESVLLLVLALSHRLVWKDRLVRQGRWVESTRWLGREPRERVIGTVGLGNIAREALRLLRAVDPARLLAFDPFVSVEQAAAAGVELVDLDRLLTESDYVLINCPLSDATRGLIGEKELRRMKPTAMLVNTARGPIVNEAALIRALEEGWIAGAALDVFEREPVAPDNPLLRMDNVIVSSHSVGWTEELFRDMGRIDCEGALAIRAGRPPTNVVNREVLTRPGFLEKLANYGERQ